MSTRLMIISALLLAAPAVASADSGDHSHPHVRDNPRLGFFGGFGLAVGEISCEGNGCDGVREAGGIEGHVGYAFSSNLALIGEVWAMENREDDVTLTYVNTAVGVRYWIVPIIWLQAGVGSGHARVKYTGIIDVEGRSDNIATLMLGAGVEVIRGERWAMDVELKFAQGANEDAEGDEVTTGRMTGLGVGFTWF